MSCPRVYRRLVTAAAVCAAAALVALLPGCGRAEKDHSAAARSLAGSNAPASVLPTDSLPDAGIVPTPVPVAPVTSEIIVPQPDASTAEPTVQAKLTQHHARFDGVMATNPPPATRAESWALLGMVYFAYEFPGTAAACFTNAVFHAPADHRAWYGLAECRFEEDDFSGAVSAMETALQQMRGSTNATPADQNNARRFLGDALERLGRVPEALEQFQAVLVNEPRDLYSLVKAGQLHSLSGGGLGAVHYLESALKRAPKNQTIRSLLAQEYRRSGLTNGVALTTTTVDSGTPQASPLVRPDPWRQAAATLVESPTMFIRRGNRLAQAGQPGKAVAAYEAALRLDPTNTTAAINLASALFSVRRPTEARRVIEEVAARGDSSEELRYNLALARAATGATNEALAVAEQWRRERPDEPMALQLEGQVRQRIGDLAGAQMALREYLRLKPGTVPITLQLARLQSRSGQAAEARKTLEDGLMLTPNNPALSFELARLLALNPLSGVRDPNRAVELLTPLLARKPALPQIETMILALHASGNQAAAAERFKRLTNSMSKRTNAVLVTRLERLGAVLASPKPVEEPWPFALNARASEPGDADADGTPAKTP